MFFLSPFLLPRFSPPCAPVLFLFHFIAFDPFFPPLFPSGVPLSSSLFPPHARPVSAGTDMAWANALQCGLIAAQVSKALLLHTVTKYTIYLRATQRIACAEHSEIQWGISFTSQHIIDFPPQNRHVFHCCLSLTSYLSAPYRGVQGAQD